MELYNLQNQKFRKYGRKVTEVDVTALINAAQELPVPEGVVYEPTLQKFEELSGSDQIKRKLFGEQPAQIGYCFGHNSRLDAVEYHRSSEFIVAATDLVLLLGCRQDITEDFTYDTSLVEAFYVSQGTCVELYSTSLHYAPCSAWESGFRALIILPEGTNTPCKEQTTTGEDRLLTANNKWLISHPEAHIEGSFTGLIGENPVVTI